MLTAAYLMLGLVLYLAILPPATYEVLVVINYYREAGIEVVLYVCSIPLVLNFLIRAKKQIDALS